MRFSWDERKRLTNLRKHLIDFVGVEALFDGHTVTVEDNRFSYKERRFITFGLLNRQVVAVAHTETRDHIHVISIRKTYRHEQEAYFKYSPYTEIPH